MAPSKPLSDLVKIGYEGFTMLEYLDQQKKKGYNPPPPPFPQHQPPQYMVHRYQHQPQKPHAYQVIVPAAKEEKTVTMDCYKAAELYGGKVIGEYSTSTNSNNPKTYKKPSMRTTFSRFYNV